MTKAKSNNAGADFKALDACHQQIAEHLARLDALVEHLVSEGVDAHAQGEARAIEAFFSETSQRHHLDEESKVFPPLLSSSDEALVATVRMLQQDHGWIEEDWRELSPQLQAIAEGYSAYDLDFLRAATPIFTDLIREHIVLEKIDAVPPNGSSHLGKQV